MYVLFERGGYIMYLLLGCSILSVAVILERLFFWLALRRQRNEETVKAILRFLQGGDFKSASDVASRSKDFLARIFNKAISSYRKSDLTSFNTALDIASVDELDNMKRHLHILDTIITTAPLLGILGTVVGIINAFGLLGSAAGDPRVVSGGIALALLTTAGGLVVALVSLVPYNYFNSCLEQAASEIEKTTSQFCITLNDKKKVGSDQKYKR